MSYSCPYLPSQVFLHMTKDVEKNRSFRISSDSWYVGPRLWDRTLHNSSGNGCHQHFWWDPSSRQKGTKCDSPMCVLLIFSPESSWWKLTGMTTVCDVCSVILRVCLFVISFVCLGVCLMEIATSWLDPRALKWKSFTKPTKVSPEAIVHLMEF